MEDVQKEKSKKKKFITKGIRATAKMDSTKPSERDEDDF